MSWRAFRHDHSQREKRALQPHTMTLNSCKPYVLFPLPQNNSWHLCWLSTKISVLVITALHGTTSPLALWHCANGATMSLKLK